MVLMMFRILDINHIDEIKKVKSKQITTEDKMVHLQRIANIIAVDKENAPLATRMLLQIKKESLSFAVPWWTLVHHNLGPTICDNILCPNRATLVIGHRGV